MEILLVIAISTITGAALALPAFVPFIRRRARANLRVRRGFTIGIALSVFVIFFGIWTRGIAESGYLIGTLVCSFSSDNAEGCDFDYALHKDEIISMLWLDSILPPPLRPPCQSETPEVCDFIDNPEYPSHFAWRDYLLTLGFALLPAMVCALLIWRITQPIDKKKKHLEHEYLQIKEG